MRRQHIWSTLKNAKAGDKVWFYFPAPISAVVASGVALADAEPGEDWPYTMLVGELVWLPQTVSLPELRNQFPQWTWARNARVRTYLPAEIADYLSARSRSAIEPLAEEIPDTEFREGKGIQVTINRYERDPAARAACIIHYGVTCQICQVDLATVYGPKASGLIHVHHLRPLAHLGGEYRVQPAQDLIPVCPNCHAVLHRSNPPFSPEEVRSMILKAREITAQQRDELDGAPKAP